MFETFDNLNFLHGDPRRINCNLDGVAEDCQKVFNFLRSGAAIPASIAQYQNRPGFSFEEGGFGIFSGTVFDKVRLPNVNYGVGEITINGYRDVWLPREGIFFYPVSWFTPRQTIAGSRLHVENFSDCANKIINAIEPLETDNTLGSNTANYLKDILNEALNRNLQIGVVAYAIATAYQETQNFTKLQETAASVALHGNTTYDVGRGFVGLTTKGNYDEIGKRLGLDLISNPEAAGIGSGNEAAILFEFLDYQGKLGRFNPNQITSANPDYATQRNAVNKDTNWNIPRAKGSPRLTIGQRIQNVASAAARALLGC